MDALIFTSVTVTVVTGDIAYVFIQTVNCMIEVEIEIKTYYTYKLRLSIPNAECVNIAIRMNFPNSNSTILDILNCL